MPRTPTPAGPPAWAGPGRVIGVRRQWRDLIGAQTARLPFVCSLTGAKVDISAQHREDDQAEHRLHRRRYSRQHVIDLLNRMGHTQLAEEASRALPDPADVDQISAWLMQHGLTRDALISEMGGSP